METDNQEVTDKIQDVETNISQQEKTLDDSVKGLESSDNFQENEPSLS